MSEDPRRPLSQGGGLAVVLVLFAAMFSAGVLAGLFAAFALGWRP